MLTRLLVPPTIRKLNADELAVAFSVVYQLRDHLDFDEFERRTLSQYKIGYALYGAFDCDGTLFGVIGMRPVTTLARGDHLHIDDLVVDQKMRGLGIGKMLLDFAENWALDNAIRAIFLDSRQEVIQFYSALGYGPHSATLMKKCLSPKHTT